MTDTITRYVRWIEHRTAAHPESGGAAQLTWDAYTLATNGSRYANAPLVHCADELNPDGTPVYAPALQSQMLQSCADHIATELAPLFAGDATVQVVGFRFHPGLALERVFLLVTIAGVAHLDDSTLLDASSVPAVLADAAARANALIPAVQPAGETYQLAPATLS